MRRIGEPDHRRRTEHCRGRTKTRTNQPLHDAQRVGERIERDEVVAPAVVID